MKLESLTVRGLLAVQGTTTLNLRDLPPGLVAIVGPNGNGKTTLLDAAPASIHRKFPSRSGKKLAEYANERDSFIQTDWVFEGRGLIRLRVNLDGVKGGSDAVITQVHADGSETPLRTANGIESDGKVSTFDEIIAEWFPSRDVLLASAVAAQNKEGSFSRIERHERQALFAKLLGLERYKAMAETAKRLAGMCDVTRAALGAQADMLASDCPPERRAAIDLDWNTAEAEKHQVGTLRLGLTGRLAKLDAERAGLQEDASRYVQVQARRQTLTISSMELMGTSGRLSRKVDEAEANAVKEVQTLAGKHRAVVQDLEERIENNKGVLDRADMIRLAAGGADLARTAIAGYDLLIAEINTELDDITARHAAAQKRLRALDHVRQDLPAARVAAGTLNTVPCGGSGDYADCAFLRRAHQASAEIPALEAMLSEHAAIDLEVATLESSRQNFLSKRHAMGANKQARQEALRALEADAKLLPAIETAEQRIKDLTAELQRAHDLHNASAEAIGQHRDEAVKALKAEQAATLDKLDAIGAELAQIDIVESETKEASEHLARVDADLTQLLASWDDTTATLARIESRIDVLARTRDRFHAAQAELVDVTGRLRQVEDHLLEYQLLAKALGKDGLPTLEIDAAGPTVSAFCNDLLATCFGSRFSVELVTQQATAKGGMKESFELKVYDNERGGDPRDLEDLSGGEQIIVDEALKNAIAAFVNVNSVSPVRTMWRDETTGPLDGQNADKYLQMLRRVREIAGVENLLFVTHNADAANAADAQIVVKNGTARISLPPYAEVA